MKLFSRLTIAALLIFTAADALVAQKRRPARRGSISVKTQPALPARSAPEALRRHETFLRAWHTLRENYFDPTFNNLDWNRIKTEYEPRVFATKTDAELHTLLNTMIGRLGKSHLAIIPPEVYRAIESAKVESKAREIARDERRAERIAAGGEESAEDDLDFDDALTEYGIGVDLRIIDEKFVITRLDKDSAAEYAGLKTGYIIDKINGVSLADLLLRVNLYNNKSANIRRYLPFQIVSAFLNGEKDSVVNITYIDETNQPKEKPIRRERLKAETITISKNMPERRLIFETRSLPDDVGYIRFNYFGIPVIEKFCNAVAEFKDKKAIVVDLRGNMGGVLATLVGLGGMLTDEEIDLGTSVYKYNSERMLAESKAKNYKGRLVFLVDNQTVSAAEVFAASVQDAKRAFVVGDTTAGEALPSIAVDLPTGAVMQYPIANYKSSKGRFLEGTGVAPDFPVSLTRKGLIEGRDEQLDKALSLIKDEKSFARLAEEPAITPGYAGPVVASALPPPTAPKKFTIKGSSNYSAPNDSKSSGKILYEAPPPPPPAARRSELTGKDPEALRIIADFLTGIGGRDAVAKIDSYELRGRTELLIKGTKNQFGLEIYREGKSKYSEIMRSDASGEIREIYNGKTHFVQTDYGMNRQLPSFDDVVERDILAPIRALADNDYFLSLKSQGIYDRDGRKVHLIDGKSKEGMLIALAFDVETKMLVNFTGSYYGIAFADYEKVGDLTLPHFIERERIMNITLDSIKLNTKIDPANFERKQNCFDRVN
jgi:C-terminal peptidase prc